MARDSDRHDKTGAWDVTSNIYRQHKRNFRVINRWIHTTVSRSRAELANPQPSQPSAAKKSKPKVQSRNSRKPQQASTTDDLAPPYTFETFSTLVCEIASSDATIPKPLLALMNITIRQRKAIANFHALNLPPHLSLWSHKPLIDLYQEALGALENAYRKRGGVEDDEDLTMGTANEDVLDISAVVRQLCLSIQQEEAATIPQPAADVEGENEWVRDAVIRAPGAKGKQKHKEYALEAYDVYPNGTRPVKGKTDNPDDEWLAIQCFILDIDRIRKRVASVWQTVVPLGSTSRVTASYITNRAMVMVKRLEHLFITDFPQYKHIQVTQSILSSKLAEFLPKASKEVLYSVKDQLMAHTFLALTAYVDILKQYPPIMKEGQFGKFKPLASRETMSPAERIREDKCILCTWLPDMYVMYKHNTNISKPGMFYGDFGLAKEFKELLEDESRPQSWALLFSCQVMLDTVHARRRVLQDDVTAVASLGMGMSNQIYTFMHDGMDYDRTMDDRKALAPSLSLGIVRLLVEDHVNIVKIHKGWDKISKQACQAYSLWHYNPWFTANAMTDAMMDYYMLGVDAMWAGGFVASAMHLWNMLKHLGYLPTSQSDVDADKAVAEGLDKDNSTKGQNKCLIMDHLLQVYGYKVFLGSLPTEQFSQRFEVMINTRPDEPGEDGRRKKYPNGRAVSPADSPIWNLHSDGYTFTRDPGHYIDHLTHSGEHPLDYVQALVQSEIRETPGAGFRGPLVNLNVLKIHDLCVLLYSMLVNNLRADLKIANGLNEAAEKVLADKLGWPLFMPLLAQAVKPGDGFNERLVRSTADIVQKVVGTREISQYLVSDDPKYDWKKW